MLSPFVGAGSHWTKLNKVINLLLTYYNTTMQYIVAYNKSVTGVIILQSQCFNFSVLITPMTDFCVSKDCEFFHYVYRDDLF